MKNTIANDDNFNLKIFKNSEFGQLQVIYKNNEPWFYANEIAKLLGYTINTNLTRILDSDEFSIHIVNTKKGTRETYIINEPGLYSAIFNSRKPISKPFKSWLKKEQRK